MLFFTSDTHFGSDSNGIITREMRPFISIEEYTLAQIEIWNGQTTSGDTILHLGDFCNYNPTEKDWKSGLLRVQQVNAKVQLIIGNNEERVIASEFGGDSEEFKQYCLSIGFDAVLPDLELTLGGRQFYLNHFPRKHREGFVNLFGHIHRAAGLWKPYGLNVGTDLNHFRLYGEDDIFELLKQKEEFWDFDIDNNCM